MQNDNSLHSSATAFALSISIYKHTVEMKKASGLNSLHLITLEVTI